MRLKIFYRIILVVVGIMLSYAASTQILADTLEYSFHKQFAPVFKEKKVKRIYYSLELPFMTSFEYDTKTKKYKSTWVEDTFFISNNYDTNGYLQSYIRILPDGRLNKKTEYFFNEAGTLTKMIFTDSSKLRNFEFQEQLFVYEKNGLRRIHKTTVRNADTTHSTMTFYYSPGNVLVQATEISDKDELVENSFFKYDSDHPYITEENVLIYSNSGTRTATFFYRYDPEQSNRITGLFGGYRQMKKKKKSIKEFTYDFVKEAYIFETPIKKIEYYK